MQLEERIMSELPSLLERIDYVYGSTSIPDGSIKVKKPWFSHKCNLCGERGQKDELYKFERYRRSLPTEDSTIPFLLHEHYFHPECLLLTAVLDNDARSEILEYLLYAEENRKERENMTIERTNHIETVKQEALATRKFIKERQKRKDKCIFDPYGSKH